jgi:hypothetical protein
LTFDSFQFDTLVTTHKDIGSSAEVLIQIAHKFENFTLLNVGNQTWTKVRRTQMNLNETEE